MILPALFYGLQGNGLYICLWSRTTSSANPFYSIEHFEIFEIYQHQLNKVKATNIDGKFWLVNLNYHNYDLCRGLFIPKKVTQSFEEKQVHLLTHWPRSNLQLNKILKRMFVDDIWYEKGGFFCHSCSVSIGPLNALTFQYKGLYMNYTNYVSHIPPNWVYIHHICTHSNNV